MEPNTVPPPNPSPYPTPVVPPYPQTGPTPYGQSSPYPSASAMPVPPALWNPQAAASWSLLLSPAFGAWLHASNWRTLGQPAKARANMIWVWVSLAVIIGVVALSLTDSSNGTTGLSRMAGIVLLLAWYFSTANGQVKYVKEVLGNSYVKKGWGKPLLIGFALLVAYFVAAVILGVLFAASSPQALADTVKPMILEEWHKKPALKDATIQNVSLTKKEGRLYTGYVDATFSDGPQRMGLEVTNNPTTLQWKVTSLDGK